MSGTSSLPKKRAGGAIALPGPLGVGGGEKPKPTARSFTLWAVLDGGGWSEGAATPFWPDGMDAHSKFVGASRWRAPPAATDDDAVEIDGADDSGGGRFIIELMLALPATVDDDAADPRRDG